MVSALQPGVTHCIISHRQQHVAKAAQQLPNPPHLVSADWFYSSLFEPAPLPPADFPPFPAHSIPGFVEKAPQITLTGFLSEDRLLVLHHLACTGAEVVTQVTPHLTSHIIALESPEPSFKIQQILDR